MRLGTVDGQQTLVYFQEAVAGIFLADHLHEGFDGLFTWIVAHFSFATETTFKSAAEDDLFGDRDGTAIEQVIGVWIQETVSKDRWGEPYWKTQ